jgi:pantetheine-phosphate adenylyltransferase
MANAEHVFVSSSGVKEAALLGGDVSSLVPPQVKIGLEQKYKQLRG